MVRRTEVWDSFSDEEQQLIRTALKKKSAERSGEEAKLVRQYWQAQQRRSRSLLTKTDNHRVNAEYREWLRQRGMPEVFDVKTFAQFKREEFLDE